MAGSFMKESGNSRGANRLAKMSPPLDSGKNYHGRTTNIRIINDSNEVVYFRAKLSQVASEFLKIETPSGDFEYLKLQDIRAIGKKEDDGLSWIIICTSAFKKRQALVGKNLMGRGKLFRLDIETSEIDGLQF